MVKKCVILFLLLIVCFTTWLKTAAFASYTISMPIANTYLIRAKKYLVNQHPYLSLEILKKILVSTHNNSILLKSYKLIGSAYLCIFLNDKALIAHDNSITSMITKNYTTDIYIALNNLAAKLSQKKAFNKSIKFFKHSLKFAKKSRANIYNDLAIAYFFNNNIKKAIFYEQKAFKSIKGIKLQNYKDLPIYLFNLGYFKFLEKKTHNKSSDISYLEQAKQIFLHNHQYLESSLISYLLNQAD